jgi:predicted phosphoribosyltransferase
MVTRFRNRAEAGRRLVELLRDYAGRTDVIVLALPRGGVPVAYEIAAALDAPLDVFVVRKLGLPGREELAMGAIASGGIRVLNEELVQALRVPDRVIEAVTTCELRELKWREREYRGRRPLPEIRGRTVILVDDGIATGSTMRAAIAALRRLEPARLIVAAPIAAPSTLDEIGPEVDEYVVESMPDPFCAVGVWYDDFTQTSDQEVRSLLERAAGLTTGHDHDDRIVGAERGIEACEPRAAVPGQSGALRA